MTKVEFLEKLRTSLGNDLNRTIVQENVDYYNGYIDEEVRKGRSEEEVTDELGDPWAIAQTIIDGEENGRSSGTVDGTYREADGGYDADYDRRGRNYEYREASDRDDNGRTSGGLLNFLGFDTWWKKTLLVLGIVGIFVLVIAIVGSMITILAPIMIPLLLLMLIIRLLGGRN